MIKTSSAEKDTDQKVNDITEPLDKKNESPFVAAKAGMSRIDFYKTDKWILELPGDSKREIYITPKDTVPSALEFAFKKSDQARRPENKVAYDRSKFGLIEMPDFKNEINASPYVIIESHLSHQDIAEVEFKDGSFVINLSKPPKNAIHPFSQQDFLDAVNVAKWLLELNHLPQPPVEDVKSI